MKKRLLFVIATIIIIGAVVGGISLFYTLTTHESPRMDLVYVMLLDNGEEQFVGGGNSELTHYLYFSVFPQINVQTEYELTGEKVEEIKANNRMVQFGFRVYGRYMNTSQWISPEDRDRFETDDDGYRVLDKVDDVLFILKDNLGQGLEGYILLNIIEADRNNIEHWSCWGIQQDGEIDKSWIGATEHYLMIPID